MDHEEIGGVILSVGERFVSTVEWMIGGEERRVYVCSLFFKSRPYRVLFLSYGLEKL